MRTRTEDAARAYVARLVAVRPRTVAEVRRRLSEKAFAPEVAAGAVAWAEEAGILSDELFAQLYAEDRLLSRPCSRRVLAQELRDRGVDAALAERAAQAALPELGEEDLARRALTTRLPLWQGLDPVVARRRAAAFLLRRGFSPHLAQEEVWRVFGGG